MKRILCVMTALATALLPNLTLSQEGAASDQVLLLSATVEAQPGIVVQVDPVAPPVEATPEGEGDKDAEVTPEEPQPKPPVEQAPPGTLRFHLMDGSIITGKLETDTLPIKTEFGDLVVPITSILSFSPGLDSHPLLDQKVSQLIQQLGAPDAGARDQAQAELIGYGKGLMNELSQYADDEDAERKVRIATITEELFAQDDSFAEDTGPTVSLVRLDTIVTAQFTVAGSIQQDLFNIQSKFGKLEVKLADIKAAERLTSQAPEIRRSVDVAGTDMAGRSMKNTGIKVNRGDRVIISAEGQITMSPWGSNTITGPDGMPNNGMYAGNIPMGALAGRIGDKGDEFLVGSKNSFVAQRSGTLYLGFAMQANWANYQFPGKFEARVRVVPAD